MMEKKAQAVAITALRVVQRTPLAEGVIGLGLAATEGETLPIWTPGAHIDLQTQDRTGQPVYRQYSLCGDQDAAYWQIAVREEETGRGGSQWLHHAVKEGDVLKARGPRNLFELVDTSAKVTLFAGGIGITPLLTMARHLQRQGRAFELHYHVRNRASAAFLDVLTQTPLAAHTHVWADDAAPPPLQSLIAAMEADAWVYTCGPTGYMNAVEQSAVQAGVSKDHIRREYFSAPVMAPVTAPVMAQPDEPGGATFRVRLHSSGQEIVVQPEQTVVHALASAGVNVVVSCEQGYCGSCLTRVMQGTPDHRDHFLLPEEQARNDCFTPCCSRSHSSLLVLDL